MAYGFLRWLVGGCLDERWSQIMSQATCKGRYTNPISPRV
jgi:hypothetical protein